MSRGAGKIEQAITNSFLLSVGKSFTVEDAYEAVQRADLCVLLTEWNEFRALDLNRIVRSMNAPRFADLRNVYSEQDLKRAGFERYRFVGR